MDMTKELTSSQSNTNQERTASRIS